MKLPGRSGVRGEPVAPLRALLAYGGVLAVPTESPALDSRPGHVMRVKLLVRAHELTPGGALRGGHPETIQNLLRRERSFAIVPSDTCYALAAVPTGLGISRRINRILGREQEPISLAFDDVRRVRDWARLNPFATRLLEALTPGPLTVVCPLRADVRPEIAVDVLAAPEANLGIRIPDSTIERQLVTACDSPLTTVAIRTRGTREPITDLQQATEIVLDGLAALDDDSQIAIIEGRQSFAPTHSTVVRVPASTSGSTYEIVRTGAISEAQIEKALEILSQWEISDFI